MLWQGYYKCCACVRGAFYFQRTSMPFGYNIIRQAQPQTSALPGGFGSKKGLEDFVADGFRDAGAVVLDGYLNVASFPTLAP